MDADRKRFSQLANNGNVFGPVSNSFIAQAEAELGVNFPDEYRELLTTYGAVLANGIEVYGLPGNDDAGPPLWQNVVSVTKQLRAWGQVGADRFSLIPIAEDGNGVYFYLDTFVSPETKIVAIGAGVEQECGSSLFSFLVSLADGEIRV